MNLKSLCKAMLLCGALSFAASCSSELDGPEAPIGNGSSDGVYMALDITLPSSNGSRSQTTDNGYGESTDGTEVGQDEENSVQQVLIVLARYSDKGFISSGLVSSSKLTPITSVNGYKSIAKIEKTEIAEFYNKGGNSREVAVFVFCNPTKDLLDLIDGTDLLDTGWVNAVCEVLVGGGQTQKNTSIWADNSFLMSNSEIAQRTLPATMDEWTKYNTESSAFDLSGVNSSGTDSEIDNSSSRGRGSVKVERVVARFDFKDGSELGDNTYNVIYSVDESQNHLPLFNVQLSRIGLTNVNKKFYYLPRVSESGMNTYATICGAEVSDNYVVSPNATAFSRSVTSGFENYFNYPFFIVPEGSTEPTYDFANWYFDNIDKVLGSDKLDKNKEYKIWRYTTENTIPAQNSNQTMSRTTIVVFKGKLVPAVGAFESTDENIRAMANAMGDGTLEHPTTMSGNPDVDEAIYYFNNSIYFGWDNLRKAAIASALTLENDVPVVDEDGQLSNIRRSTSLYLAVFGDGCMGEFTWGTKTYNDSPEGMTVDVNSANYLYEAWLKNSDDNKAYMAMKNAMTTQNIAIYESSVDPVLGPGYYFYYYYKNRHNDNLDNGTMGTMEFATVRNNIYKLAVTKISALGHPRIPENDPDKPTPDTPDESDDIYITVTCRVLPWTVRINNIEF